MSKHDFRLRPQGVIFMRDARPMEDSDAGLGANWPRPDQLYAALHHAFLTQWPELQPWESADGQAHTFRDKRLDAFRHQSKDKNRDSSLRFGALKTVGPFPRKDDGRLFLPCPLDLGMELIPCTGTDLPKPLTHAFLPREKGKVSLPAWLPADAYRQYLEHGTVPAEALDKPEHLYDAERNIGVAINPATGAAADSKLYQAEYLRLAQDVTMAFAAQCDLVQRGNCAQVTDVLARPDALCQVIIGGQQGIADLEDGAPLDFPSADIRTRFLRWTLISPACYRQGWFPSWLDADGNVMLKDITRHPNEPRLDWKRRQAEAQPVGGRLIAARLGKPLPVSSWNVSSTPSAPPAGGRIHAGPKPTMLLVPAGSAYVFECASVEQAQTLARLLSAPNPRSDAFGEKGLGLGLCSSVEVND